jgi:hypothetical protein
MSNVDVESISKALQTFLEKVQQPVVYQDPADGARHTMSPAVVSAANGFLPAVLVAGEAVWREATGKGFSLDITRDSTALLGFRVERVGAGSFSTVMLAAVEAIHQVSDSNAAVVSDFNALWSAATERVRRDHAIGVVRQTGPHP